VAQDGGVRGQRARIPFLNCVQKERGNGRPRVQLYRERTFALSQRGRRKHLLDRRDGALVMITAGGRSGARVVKRAAEEGRRRLRLAVIAEQDIEHLPVLVDRPIAGALLFALVAEQEDLVHPPARARPATVPAHVGRQERAEGLDPAQHGALGDVDPSLHQEDHRARGGARMAELPAHRREDNLPRPAIPGERRCGVLSAAAMAASTPLAVPPNSVSPVAFRGGLVARRTGWHEVRTLPATANVANSCTGPVTATMLNGWRRGRSTPGRSLAAGCGRGATTPSRQMARGAPGCRLPSARSAASRRHRCGQLGRGRSAPFSSRASRCPGHSSCLTWRTTVPPQHGCV
jgi:hypothetical protein